MVSDEEVRERYGDHSVISRKGDFVLVHLDCPDDELVQSRTDDFDPGEYFEDDCPLCAVQRASGIFVFEGFPTEEEEILLE